MKKALIVMFLITGAVIPVFAGTFMVEQWGADTVRTDDISLYDELEVSFEVEQPTLVSIVYGASFFPSARSDLAWIALDENAVNESEFEFYRAGETFIYYTQVEAGSHSIKFVCDASNMTFIVRPRLQVMVFDESQSNVTESPPDEQPGIQPRSILSTGPSVIVLGCTGVYDKTGSKVDCQISGDRVYLDPLPAGTYFVSTRETASATKITKVH